MNDLNSMGMTSKAVAEPETRPSGNLITLVRILAFPLSTNLWLALLFVSQKVFVVPGLLMAGFGNRGYRRDLLLSVVISLVAIFTYIVQYPNPYAKDHLIGFLLFAWSMPPINHAVRNQQRKLLTFLTYLTLINALIGFFFLFSDIDLTAFRGLNKIVGKDGVTGRVYFESSSLAAVFLMASFRKRWMQIAALILTMSFVVFVARSVVVIAMLFVNLAMPYVLRSSPIVKFLAFSFTIFLFTIVYIYLPILRPDVSLSLNAKQFQLDLIFGSIDNVFTGWGWGTFFPELATDLTQPYQVEMQLPMLLLQIGILPFAMIAVLILGLFFSVKDRSMPALARFGVYMLIGFNNPWLFLPSWFLTCQLLFRNADEH